MVEVMLAGKFSNRWAEHFIAKEVGAYVQPKIDGMRAVFANRTLTRSMRVHPSKFLEEVRKDFKSLNPPFAYPDGEILAGIETFGGDDIFRQTMKLRKAVYSTPMTFYIFDDAARTIPYWEFYRDAVDWFAAHGGLTTVNDIGVLTITRTVAGQKVNYCLLPSFKIRDLDSLFRFEQTFLSAGAEGLIFRRLNSPYRNGRCTASTGNLMKLKRWEDAEGTIVGFKELLSNQNEKTTAPNGLSQRSSHLENKIPTGTLGAFELSYLGQTLFVGTGMTDAERADFWARRSELLGQKVTFKYFAVSGGYTVPRHPIFKNIRGDE